MDKVQKRFLLTLITKSKKLGLKRLKLADFEIEFESTIVPSTDRTTIAAPKITTTHPPVSEIPSEPMPTEEQILFWSTGYDPELERKAIADAHAQNRKPLEDH